MFSFSLSYARYSLTALSAVAFGIWQN